MSNPAWFHRWQPTRLPRPWDSPGKNTGVGCHFPLQCMKLKSESEVSQSCPTLSGPMDCSPPGSSIHGILQARILEWVVISFSIKHTKSIQRDYKGNKDDAVEVLYLVCQQIRKTQQLPQHWKRSVFIPIPEKGNAKECPNYCTIALTSHARKIIFKILQAKLQQYVN